EVRIDGPELAPDALDVAIDGAVVDIDIVAIGDVEQLVAGFYNTRPLGECFEYHELGHRQANHAAIPQHLVTGRVHDEVTSFELWRFFLGGTRRPFAPLQFLPPKDGADAGDQQPLGKRFGNVIVGAHGETESFVQLIVLGGEKDHRD